MGRIFKGTIMWVWIAILAAPAMARAADLSLTTLAGTWHNADPNSGGIVTLIISDTGGAQIQAFSACSPELCDWGIVDATVYGRNESSVKARTFLATYEADDAELFMTGSRAGANLRVDVLTRFKEGSGRSHVAWTGVFTRE